jgi:5-methylcytosine-specific restriction endonuclease McrA
MAWATRANAPKRLRGRASQERRARVLARYPICALCRRAPSTIADHIQNLAAGGADTEANMQGVCVPCHDTKTAQEAQRPRLSRLRAPEPHPGVAPRLVAPPQETALVPFSKWVRMVSKGV